LLLPAYYSSIASSKVKDLWLTQRQWHFKISWISNYPK